MTVVNMTNHYRVMFAITVMVGATLFSVAPNVNAMSAEAKESSSASYFRYAIQRENGDLLSLCVATSISTQWFLTAAHCIQDDVTKAAYEVMVFCPDNEADVSTRVVEIRDLHYHPTHDVALFSLFSVPDCVGTTNTPVTDTITKGDEATGFFSWTLPHWPATGVASPIQSGLAAATRFALEELQRDKHTFLLLDEKACLQPGDSGYPIYVSTKATQIGWVGMLIGGTEECPGYQRVVRLYTLLPWITELLVPATLSNTAVDSTEEPASDCGVDGCLLLDSDRDYCSFDASYSFHDVVLANNARLTLAAGQFPIANGEMQLPQWLDIETIQDIRRFYPRESARITFLYRDDDTQSDIDRLEVSANYADESDDSIKLGFRAKYVAPAGYSLLDASNATTFLANGLNMRVQPAEVSAYFAQFDNQSLLFAPCKLPDQSDNAFRFTLDDNTSVTARVRVTSGSYQVGYYLGRLLDARVETSTSSLLVNNHFDLDFLGNSLTIGEIIAPTLVVRTPKQGDSCGFVFDANQWTSVTAVEGYVAYLLQCDDRLGKRVSLKSAEYPDKFVFQ